MPVFSNLTDLCLKNSCNFLYGIFGVTISILVISVTILFPLYFLTFRKNRERDESVRIYKLRNSEIQKFRNSEIQKFRNSEIQKFRNSEIQKFRNSEIQKFRNSEIQKFRNSEIQKFRNSKIQKFENSKIRNSEIQKFKNSEIQKFKNSEISRQVLPFFISSIIFTTLLILWNFYAFSTRSGFSYGFTLQSKIVKVLEFQNFGN
ncbi:hypothetical protein L5515_009482 [Caenorhabditis briggsae]|uniref:Transmembrane protein n=1 Tax=Caenorhabditis briggsae TaxID=6238 RepID=A0AAE9JNZ3_CAEBR|nr:hypothetical protein L5515_009482 [Caenorhabditis briggsae]